MAEELIKEYKRKWYLRNKENISLRGKERRIKFKEEINTKQRLKWATDKEYRNKKRISTQKYYRENYQSKKWNKWSIENPVLAAKSKEKYRINNREKCQEINRQYRLKNKGIFANKEAKRRVNKLDATSPWADLNKIKEIYIMAQRLRKNMPKQNFHVDHIIPLKGKNVCGLHVENNLRIIDGLSNMKKGNKLEGLF